MVVCQCKYGFMVVGSRNRSCEVDARWTGRQPECREINCSPPGNIKYFQSRNIFISISGHGFLPNGWIDGSKTTLHAVVTFKCYDGMKFEGASDR